MTTELSPALTDNLRHLDPLVGEGDANLVRVSFIRTAPRGAPSQVIEERVCHASKSKEVSRIMSEIYKPLFPTGFYEIKPVGAGVRPTKATPATVTPIASARPIRRQSVRKTPSRPVAVTHYFEVVR